MKFRIYLNNAFDGPYGISDLCHLPGFSLDASVCPDGDFAWQPARDFPMITQFYDQQITSGDYDPNGAVTDKSPSLPGHNWRKAIIDPEFVETQPYYRTLPLKPSEPSDKPSRAMQTRSPSGPAPTLSVGEKVQNHLGHKRKAILLSLLGFVAAGVYYPQTEAINDFYSKFWPRHSSIEAMGTRFRLGGSPHLSASWRHKFFRQVKEKEKSTLGIQGLNTTKKSADSEISEIDSEDMGNGFISRTIVITHIRDGARVQQTKTIVVPAHPRKAKKARTKSGSAQRVPALTPSAV